MIPPAARTLLLVSSVLVLGCLDSLDERGQDLETPPGTRTPVIQGLLDPRATIQTFWVEWSIPSDSIWQGEPRPIAPNLVALELVGPGGTISLIPGAPSQFTATVQVMSDSTYQLQGSIDGTSIQATVRIPDSIRVTEPASDTVRLTKQNFKVLVPYDFTAPGASVYVMNEAGGSAYLIRSTTGTQAVYAFTDTLRLSIEAYEAYGGDWLAVNERPAITNITGAYGFLGAVVRSQTIIVIVQ